MDWSGGRRQERERERERLDKRLTIFFLPLFLSSLPIYTGSQLSGQSTRPKARRPIDISMHAGPTTQSELILYAFSIVEA